MAQPFNLGNSFLGKSTIELVNPANTAVSTTISVDSDGDLFFQRYVDDLPKGNLKFPVHSYGQSEKKDMHTDANGDVRFANTWTEAVTVNLTDDDLNTGPVGPSPIAGVEYLVIAGGGGGGYQAAGGGGAGGFIYGTDLTLDTFSVSVGTKGLGSIAQGSRGENGRDSIFGTIISAGGGGGGSVGPQATHSSNIVNFGADGGSGGGGSSAYERSDAAGGTGNTPSTDPSQGNDGGRSNPESTIGSYNRGAGGGGGANSAGDAGSGAGGGNGGSGKSSSITGTAVDYAGGGGGGCQDDQASMTLSQGGIGGGGAGGGYQGSGTNNNGNHASGYGSGGGGGGRASGSVGVGGNGSDGIVVLAYPDTENALAYIDGNLAYSYSAPTDDAPKRSGYHVYEFVSGAGTISATEADPAFYSKELENACLFDGTSYLSRTNKSSVTDELKTTVSLWYKIGNRMGMINSFIDTFDGSNNHSRLILRTNVSDQFQIGVQNSYDYNWQIEGISTAVFKDPNAWYHFVLAIDTQAANKLIAYANGVEIIGPNSAAPTVNTFTQPFINKAAGPVRIGRGSDGSEPFNGYLANIHFIDGQALDANAFGTYREGVYIPKEYTGEYGTNGFHLDFSDADDLGKDVSGRGNGWATVN